MAMTSSAADIRPAGFGLAPLTLIVTGAMIGSGIAIAKLALMAGVSPISFLFWGVLVAAFVVYCLALMARQAPVFTWPTLSYGLVSGVLAIAAPNLLLFMAIPHVGAGFVALSAAFPPLYTYLLALILRMERPNALRAGGVLAGMAGAIVLGLSKAGLNDADAFWIVVVMCAPVITAAGNIHRAMFWPKGTTPLQLAPLMLAGAALSAGIFAVIVESQTMVPTFFIGMTSFLLPAQIAIFSLMYILYFVLLKVAGPVYFSQIGSVAAIVGAIAAVLVFGETFPPAILPAGLLIAIGVTLVTLAPFLARPKAA